MNAELTLECVGDLVIAPTNPRFLYAATCDDGGVFKIEDSPGTCGDADQNGTAVRADDRAALERLCHYLLRPPLAQERLALLPGGRICCTLAHPWSDGTRALLFEPVEFLEKLAVLSRARGSIWSSTTDPRAARAWARVRRGALFLSKIRER